MKKTILSLSIILLFLAYCDTTKKNSTKEEIALIMIAKPSSYQVSASITNGSTAMANSMVYFSKATTTTSSSIRATTTATTADTGPVFDTSAQTDDQGNINFTLTVGEYQAIITGIDNKSQAFKIKIENSNTIGINKDGKATITYADGTIKVAILKVSGALNSASPSAAISFVCGYNPKGDTAPPELTSVELESSKIDVSSGSGKVKVKAKLADGYEGSAAAKKATGIKSVTAKLFSPKRITGSGYTAYATLTLNSTSGLYEGEATLTNYVDNGTWNVGIIEARDKSGNERQYIYDSSKSTKNYSFNGCGQKIDSKILIPTFEVTGSSPDTAAPVLGTVSLSYLDNVPATVNANAATINISTGTATANEALITVTVTGATDAGGSGNASGIAYMDARLQSYSWWNSSSNYLGNAIYVRLDLISGTSTNGTYSGTATIRQYAEGYNGTDGTWKLGGIWVTDKAGNSLWTDRATLNKSFTITNAATTATADFYAPELKSVTIDKTDVNFDQSFTITTEVADIATETTTTDQTTTTTTATTTSSSTTPSGMKAVNVILYSPLKLLDNTLGTKKSVSMVLNASTSKYEGTATFLTANNEEGGTWKVAWIEVVDKAGNYRVYRLTEGYSYYTYVKLTRTDGDISSSFNVSTIAPASITRN